VSRHAAIRNRLLVAGASLLVAAGACSRRDPVSASGPEAIQFALRTIDGHSLPYQIDQSAGGATATVVNDMLLTMVSDDTWTIIGHETVTTNGTPAQVLLRGNGAFTTTVGTDTFRDANGVVVWTGEPVQPGYVLIDTLGMRYLFGP